MPVAIRVIIVSSPCRSERAADDTNGHPPHQTTIEVRTKLRSPGDSPNGRTSSRPNSELPSGEYMMIGTVRIADPMNRLSMSCTMCAPSPACAFGAWWWWSIRSAPRRFAASGRMEVHHQPPSPTTFEDGGPEPFALDMPAGRVRRELVAERRPGHVAPHLRCDVEEPEAEVLHFRKLG